MKQDFLREAMAGLTVRSRILWLALGVAVLFHLLLAALVPSAQLHSPKLASAKPPIRFSLKSSSPPSEKDAAHRALQEPSVNSDASMGKMAAPATGVKEVLPHDPSQDFRAIPPKTPLQNQRARAGVPPSIQSTFHRGLWHNRFRR